MNGTRKLFCPCWHVCGPRSVEMPLILVDWCSAPCGKWKKEKKEKKEKLDRNQYDKVTGADDDPGFKWIQDLKWGSMLNALVLFSFFQQRHHQI